MYIIYLYMIIYVIIKVDFKLANKFEEDHIDINTTVFLQFFLHVKINNLASYAVTAYPLLTLTGSDIRYS